MHQSARPARSSPGCASSSGPRRVGRGPQLDHTVAVVEVGGRRARRLPSVELGIDLRRRSWRSCSTTRTSPARGGREGRGTARATARPAWPRAGAPRPGRGRAPRRAAVRRRAAVKWVCGISVEHGHPEVLRAVAPGLRPRVEQASRCGTTVSGSGRSEMSSPGNASWCIAVRMSPGSTAYARQAGLRGVGQRHVVERRLAGAVEAPALVVVDRRVGADRDAVRRPRAAATAASSR